MTLIPEQRAIYDSHLLPSLPSLLPRDEVSDLLDYWADALPEVAEIERARPVRQALPTEGSEYWLQKRLFDLTLALLLLPVAGLVLLILSVAVFLTSGFPIFYRQSRVGRNGKLFNIVKFRTMQNNAEQALAEFLLHHPEIREEWSHTHKLKQDPRITPLGRWLRNTSLDEVPQIFNVLAGDMSFVGPRPIVSAECARYGERFLHYASAMPGITGLWQVSGRSNLSYGERVCLDEQYARTWSTGRDLSILWRTPRAVLRRDGSC